MFPRNVNYPGTGNAFPLITPRNVFPVYGEPFHVDCFEAHNAPKIEKGRNRPLLALPRKAASQHKHTRLSQTTLNWPSSQTKIAHNSGSLKVSSPAPIHHSAGRSSRMKFPAKFKRLPSRAQNSALLVYLSSKWNNRCNCYNVKAKQKCYLPLCPKIKYTSKTSPTTEPHGRRVVECGWRRQMWILMLPGTEKWSLSDTTICGVLESCRLPARLVGLLKLEPSIVPFTHEFAS